jgi:hypothetical protein
MIPKFGGALSSYSTNHPSLGLPECSPLSGFETKIFYEFPIPHMHATYPVHFIILNLMIAIILFQQYSYRVPQYATFSRRQSPELLRSKHSVLKDPKSVLFP